VPIVSNDIKIKLSTKSGSAGNSLPQANVSASLGKYISTTELVNASLNNLFDNVTGSENTASTVDYRCVFVHNSHATLTYFSAVAYLPAQVSGGAAMDIAIDNTAASPIGSSSAQAVQITNETTTPTGIGSFSAPTTQGTGLSLGDILPGFARAIWIRRTAANTSALNSDGATLAITGDTTA
jgi:hypothetical protein